MTRDQIKKIKRLPIRELEAFLMRFYVESFKDGLQEGKKEFDDAVILTEEEARERIPEEVVNKLLEGM